MTATANETALEIKVLRQGPEVVKFYTSGIGSYLTACEWHESGAGVKTYSIDEVWVAEFARGRGVGHALMTRVLQHYDALNMPMRLVVAGCCMPRPDDTAKDIDEMHTAQGHRYLCDQQTERLSHHGLQRWYRSYGFVDRTDCDSWTGECGCSYSLYRPVPQ